MEYLIYKTFAKAYFYEEKSFDKYIKSLQNDMLNKMFFEKANKFENYYIFHYEKMYWDDFRIEQEIDEHFKIKYSLCMHPITSKWVDRYEVHKLIEDKKPFDIKLCFNNKGVPPKFTQDDVFRY